MVEVWKDIVGYEGLYQVSNFGNVKSLNYRHKGYALLLTPKRNKGGRLWVGLYKEGKQKPHLIHRLVGTAFVPNPNGMSEINHIDEDPTNNRFDNLEWCSREYNINYTIGRHPEKYKVSKADMNKPRAIHKPSGRKNVRRIDLEVIQYTLDGIKVRCWANAREVFNETGMSDWSISECCRGKRKSAYGFEWHYAI